MSRTVDIAVLNEDEEGELRSLLAWLRDDEDLDAVEISSRLRSPHPGEMGAVIDVVEVVLQLDGVAVAAITAIVTWLSTRRKSIKIRIRSGERELEIESADAKAVERTAAQLIERMALETRDSQSS